MPQEVFASVDAKPFPDKAIASTFEVDVISETFITHEYLDKMLLELDGWKWK